MSNKRKFDQLAKHNSNAASSSSSGSPQKFNSIANKASSSSASKRPTITPKKERSPSSESSDDDEEEDDDDEDNGEPRSSNSAVKAKNKKKEQEKRELLPPMQMHEFCKTVLDMTSRREMKLGSKKRATATFDVLFKPVASSTQLPADLADLQHSFRTYLKTATSLRNYPMEEALRRVMEFVEDEQSIEYHPEFPKRPKQAFHFYVERRLGKGTSFVKVPTSLHTDFRRKDDPLVKECKRAAEAEREKYGKVLEKFLNTHRAEMFDRQVGHLEKKLKNYTKQPAKVKKEAGSPQKKLSAFDFFKNSKKHKYTEMEPDAREAKLRRHFEKLDPDKKIIFEELAANM